ncbi:hypothetical protein Tco_0937027 [Tanacetum coccineum]|uniref:Uncharacterized protein n=1 Tax=Tanacetum coccineum TaxID=301880 RepID=A0ABQ5DE67_9ASTR
MLSEAQRVSLRIASGVRFRRRPTTKGVGLRVASSHTGNHREDDFTPLETIRRFLGANGGISKTVDNVANPNVASTSLGTNRDEDGSYRGKNKENIMADKEKERERATWRRFIGKSQV